MDGRQSTKKLRPMFVRALVWCPIVAIVFAILIQPSLPVMLPKKRHTDYAQNTASQFRNAISVYFIEYKRYPLGVRKEDLTTTTGHPLLTIIVGNEDPAALKHNPRRIAFYSGRLAQFKSGKYTRGIQYDENGPSFLWDPWGNNYQVRLDTDYDDQVEDPEFPEQFLPETILVWSAGPDGNFSTWDDNIKTW